jgi:hypothetical protein
MDKIPAFSVIAAIPLKALIVTLVTDKAQMDTGLFMSLEVKSRSYSPLSWQNRLF